MGFPRQIRDDLGTWSCHLKSISSVEWLNVNGYVELSIWRPSESWYRSSILVLLYSRSIFSESDVARPKNIVQVGGLHSAWSHVNLRPLIWDGSLSIRSEIEDILKPTQDRWNSIRNCKTMSRLRNILSYRGNKYRPDSIGDNLTFEQFSQVMQKQGLFETQP